MYVMLMPGWELVHLQNHMAKNVMGTARDEDLDC